MESGVAFVRYVICVGVLSAPNLSEESDMTYSVTMWFGAAAMSLSACASTGVDRDAKRLARYADDPRLGEQVDRVCFANTIDDFRENTEDSVILRRGVSDDYLVFVNGCRDLEYANALALQNSGSCLRRQDRLTIFQQGFGRLGRDVSPNFCAVDVIYIWNEDATEAADEPQINTP